MTRTAEKLWRALIHACFPPRCHICDRLYPPDRPVMDRGGDGAFEAVFSATLAGCLCPACRSAVSVVKPPICGGCGLMFREGGDHGYLCDACLSAPRRFVRARAFGVYDRSLRKVIHQLKYQGRFALAAPLSRLLLAAFDRHWRSDRPDRIIPVPLHRRKMRQRGFNQAFLLVKGWPRMAIRCGVGRVPPVDTRVLFRVRETGTQAGMDMIRRQRNVEGAFLVRRPESVIGAHLLLVDDVYTTGATAEACTDPLLRAGARRVDLLTLAQTPRYRDAGMFHPGLPVQEAEQRTAPDGGPDRSAPPF